MSFRDEQALRAAIAESPDAAAYAALSDLLREAGEDAEADWLAARSCHWRWAERFRSYQMCFVWGHGTQPCIAYFADRPPTEADGPGWGEDDYHLDAGPPGCETVRVMFESWAHRPPASRGRGRAFNGLSVRQINAQAEVTTRRRPRAARRAAWLMGDHGPEDPETWILKSDQVNRCGYPVAADGDTLTPEILMPDPAAIEDVYSGASPGRLAAAVERAGGWWLPLGGPD